MSAFPESPRLVKGAIVGFDLFNPLASVIIFQYNPDTLTRSLAAQTVGSDSAARSEALRLTGPPVESISLKVEIDATDQLERADAAAASLGIYPQLASLEMLLYPKSVVAITNAVLSLAGTIELIPPEAPMTLFIWGPKRVVPVRLKDFSITEDAYDANLNPIRASVSLNLRVLSYSDLPLTHPGYALFLAHQVVKEAMATVGSVSSLAAVGAGNIKLF